MCQMYAKSGRMCWGGGMGAWSWLWLHRVYLFAAARSLLVWLIALLPIRSDPIRPASIFFFVSFPFLTVTFASSFAPLRFDLIARRARARATCGSYSSATSTAAQADAPTPYTRVHATCNSRNPAEASGMLRIKHTMLLGCVPKKRLVNAKNEEEMQEKK